MLTRLTLANFKSWDELREMRLAPLTGLFGANSSGKTSIIQSLLLLKQTVESPDRAQALDFGDKQSLVNLGSLDDVSRESDPIRPPAGFDYATHGRSGRFLGFGLSWTLPQRLQVKDPVARSAAALSSDEMEFTAAVVKDNGRPIPAFFRYDFDGAVYGLQRDPLTEGKYDFIGTGGFELVRRPGRTWPLPAPVKCYGFPDRVRADFQNAGFLADLELEFEQLFSRIHYLGPLREYPEREYTWAGAEPADMGRRGERVVQALLASRQRGVTIGRGKGRSRLSLEAYLADWLRKLGLIHSFSIEAIAEGSNLYRVWVQQSSASPRVLITDVGFGVSQILPVLALCFYVPEGSVIILEQPEIHLHPRVQAGLADVFIDAIQKRGVQIILESHSEHLLRRLQRRIAEEEFQRADAALYFCEMRRGASRLTELELDPYGNITNWPPGFFGDEFEEMAQMSSAIIRRKKNAGA